MSTPIVAHRDRTAIRQVISRLPHALLIAAEPGLDGAGVAEQIATSSPSDILRLQPLEKKTTISTEQIRDLTAHLRTHSPARRVIIIQPADTMTESAQNALLKALEEPSDATHFLLVTTHSAQLLPTIRSRCQTLTLHRTSPAQDETILTGSSLSATERQQILFLAAGRPLLLQQLANQPKLFAEYQQIAADAKTIFSQPGSYAALKIIPSYASNRSQALKLIEILLHFITFQMKQHRDQSALHQIAERTVAVENALKANGNIKLALLKLVI